MVLSGNAAGAVGAIDQDRIGRGRGPDSRFISEGDRRQLGDAEFPREFLKLENCRREFAETFRLGAARQRGVDTGPD